MTRPLNKCSPCGQDFSTLRTFDEHRVGFHAFTYPEGLKMNPSREDGRRCLSTPELTAESWWQDSDERWHLPNDWEDQSWRWEQDPDEVSVG